MISKYTRGLSPYVLILIITYYILPMIIKDTGSGMKVLLVLMPLMVLIYSAVYGKNHGFNIFYVALVALLFIPSIFIYYNSSAFIYALAYGVLGLIGNCIGSKLKNKIN